MKWVCIKESGLPVDAIEAAAGRGELEACVIDGVLYVQRNLLQRWLDTKRVPRASLVKAKRAHKALFEKPSNESPRPTKGGYRVEWIETGEGAGYYVAEVKMPSGEWQRHEMKDASGLVHFYNDVDDYGSAMDSAYVAACRLLADAEHRATEAAVDTQLAEYAAEYRQSKWKKARPVSVRRHWIAYVDGSGGEWSAKLRFPDNTAFLVQLHVNRRPVYTMFKLTKEQKAAMQKDLAEIARTEYDLPEEDAPAARSQDWKA